MLLSASTCLIPLRPQTKNVTLESNAQERQKRAIAQKRSALAQRIENLRIEFNHFHPSHLRRDSEAQSLTKLHKNNSYWKFSPLGGIGEFGYTSTGQVDSSKMYEFKTLVEIDNPKETKILMYENEKLGDYISRRLLHEMMETDLDRVSRLVSALESLTPRNWKVVPQLPLARQEPSLGLRSKEFLRKNHYRYFEIARRFSHQVEKRNILVLDQRSLNWMSHLDRTKPRSNSLNKNLATLLFREAKNIKPPKTHFRRPHKPQFESLAVNIGSQKKQSGAIAPL